MSEIDWKQIDANTPDGQRQLDRVIAERIGNWHVRQFPGSEPPAYGLFRDGTEMFEYPALSIEEVWQWAILSHWAVPHYSTDLGMASIFLMATMKAGASEDYTASISPSSSTDEWSCWFEPRYGDPEIIEYHRLPATAVCLACLKWWDTKQVKTG